jgi:hypothetical protein
MSTYGAVLIRPITASLSRKIAGVLVLGLLSLLFLGRLAVDQLGSHFKFASLASGHADLNKKENGLPLVLMLYDGQNSAPPAEERRAVDVWIAYLKSHPESRINLTLQTGSEIATENSRRIASLVKLMSSAGIDPHRVRVVELPQFEGLTIRPSGKPASLNDRVIVEIKLE